MTMKYPVHASTAAVALLLSTVAPFAAALPSVSAAASISQVQFHTVDLTPDDGQAGGIAGLTAGAGLSARIGNSVDAHPYRALQPDTATIADNFASATISQSGAPGEMASTTESHGYDHAYTSGVQRVDFLLLAHTALSVTGHIAGYAHQDAGLPYSWSGSSVLAELDLNMWQTAGYVSRTIGAFGPHPDLSYDQDFVVNYANNSDSAISMYWYTTTQSDASNGINSPVPEPEGYPMLGAGLALIGLVAYRRQRQG